MLVVGGLDFALAVANWVPVGALTPVLIVVIIGQAAATRAAVRSGRTALGYVHGGLTGFWLSYALLILGIAHNWYGVDPQDSSPALAVFLLSWSLAMLITTVLCLTESAAWVVLLALFDVALILLALGTITGHPGLFTTASALIFAFVALGAYLSVALFGPARLRQALPVGPRLLPDSPFEPTRPGATRVELPSAAESSNGSVTPPVHSSFDPPVPVTEDRNGAESQKATADTP
jgi:hypothetical protein